MKAEIKRVFGYVRSSTERQDYTYQEDIIKRAVADKGLVMTLMFGDKVSGGTFDRPEYNTMISKLEPNDLVVVQSLDRFGRDYEMIEEQWNLITREKKCYIKVCDIDLLDTTTSNNDLDSQFMSDLVLKILSYVASKEKQKISERIKNSLATKKAQGVVLGRPKATRPDNWEDVYMRYRRKEISSPQARKELGDMAKATFFKLLKDYEIDKGIRV